MKRQSTVVTVITMLRDVLGVSFMDAFELFHYTYRRRCLATCRQCAFMQAHIMKQ